MTTSAPGNDLSKNCTEMSLWPAIVRTAVLSCEETKSVSLTEPFSVCTATEVPVVTRGTEIVMPASGSGAFGSCVSSGPPWRALGAAYSDR